MEYQQGYRQGYDGTSRIDPSPSDPGYRGFIDGRNDRIADDQLADPGWAPAPTAASGADEYFGTLIGLPIVVGLIGGVVALLVGGDFSEAALITGGLTFALVLAYGVLQIVIRLLPLIILVAIVLYVLERYGIGPGLPYVGSS